MTLSSSGDSQWRRASELVWLDVSVVHLYDSEQLMRLGVGIIYTLITTLFWSSARTP